MQLRLCVCSERLAHGGADRRCMTRCSANPSTSMQAAGDEAVRAAMPGATIFKPANMVGTEDRLYNNFAQLAKARASPSVLAS